MLGESQTARIALAVPSACRDRFEFAESFTVSLAGSSRNVAELDVDDLTAAVRTRPEGHRLRALRDGRIEMFADTDGADRISSKVPANYWLTAEVSDKTAHFFYWQGRWYEIGADYVTAIDRRITEILDGQISITVPPWTTGEGHDEGWYDEQIAAQDGYVLFDKNTLP